MSKFSMILLCFLALHVSAQEVSPGILLFDNTEGRTLEEHSVNYYTTKLDANPKDVESLLMRAKIYTAMNLRDKAEADRRRAMEINPYGYLMVDRSGRGHLFNAKTYKYADFSADLSSDAFKKSFLLEEEYGRLISESNMSVDTRELLESTLRYIVYEDFESAREQLDLVAESEQQMALYQDLLGVLALKEGNVEAAITYFTNAVRESPEFTIAYHNRAVAHKIAGDYEMSTKDFKTAMSQRADLAKISFGKAKLMELQGDKESARYLYKNAMETDSDYDEAKLNYSVMLKAAGEYTEAMIEIDNLVDSDPDNVEHYYVRGGIYFIYGEYDNAVRDLEKYLESHPEDAEAHLYKGLSKFLDGDTARGCVDIKESMLAGNETASEMYLHMCE